MRNYLRLSRSQMRFGCLNAAALWLWLALAAPISAQIPGLTFPTSSEASDQKPGSILFFNYITSSAATPNTQNTEISLTNTSLTTSVAVRLFFVDGTTGVSASTFIFLTPTQTATFLASDLAPDLSGYLVAVATDINTACPIRFNQLIGEAYIKQTSGHSASLSAIAIAALATPPALCAGTTTVLNFDGVNYNYIPRVVTLDNIASRSDGNDTLFILNRVGGNLTIGGSAALIGNLFGLIYDDAETVLSFARNTTTPQFVSSLTNSFPQTAPNFGAFIPAGRTGFMKIFNNGGDLGYFGAALNFNPNANTSSNSFITGHNLTHRTLSATQTYTMQLSAPDLVATNTHSGNFTAGGTGTYTITVANSSATAMSSLLNTITVSDTLPGNLTLASFSGAGWNCSGVGTANVKCSTNVTLGAGVSTTLLMLTANVGPGTPLGTNSITNTVTVSGLQEFNFNNNSASDPTTVNCGALTVNPATLPNGAFGSAYNQTLTQTGGTPAITWSVSAGSLPAGLTLSAAGVLAGTPTASGAFNFTAKATDANGCMGTRAYTLLITCTTLNTATANFTVAGGNGSVQVFAQGGCTWTATSNDPWLTVTSFNVGTGSVNYSVAANPGSSPRLGTITITGSTFFVRQNGSNPGLVYAEDFSNGIPSSMLVIDGGTGGGAASTWTTANPCNRVVPAPIVAPFALVDASCAGAGSVQDERLILPLFNFTGLGSVVLQFYNQLKLDLGSTHAADVDVSLDGGANWINVLHQTTPDGVPTPTTKNIDITNVIAPNPANVRISYHYYGALPGGNRPTGGTEVIWPIDALRLINFTISPTNQSVPVGGGSGSVNVTAATGEGWTAQSNVPWITAVTTSGTGSGPANYSVAVNLTGAPRTGTLTIAGNTFTVNQAACPAIAITPPSLSNGTLGTLYNQALTASAGAAPHSFSIVTGTLPSGVSLSSAGVLSGTPTQIGTFNFTVKTLDALGCMGTQAYALTITCGTITINPAALLAGRLNKPYAATSFSATGGNGPYTFSLSAGALPSGMTFSNGVLAGTPTVTGSFNLTITANDSGSGCSGVRNYTLNVLRGLVKADFDGDGKTDFSVWRPSNGNWLVLNSGNNVLVTTQWGEGLAPYFDMIVPGDYDGDGKTDHAIWRGADEIWYIRKSSDGLPILQFFGTSNAPYFDIPTPGDFDGDGKTDLAVWRPSTGTFFVKKSTDGGFIIQVWGQNGDRPVAADYDGDGITDFAVWRPADGNWFIKKSTGGTDTIQWGQGLAPFFDTPVPADYDGDGKADLAIWRGADEIWYIRPSATPASPILQFYGTSNAPYFDIPTPGDYDGDGKADIGVWRPSTGTWFIRRSTDGTNLIQALGQNGDKPVPANGVR